MGFRVSNSPIQNEFDFINKMNLLSKVNFCGLTKGYALEIFTLKMQSMLKMIFYIDYQLDEQLLLMASFANFEFSCILFSKIMSNFCRPYTMPVFKIQKKCSGKLML